MSQLSTAARLIYMANQIAANFAVAGNDAAASATADHIATFWNPRMRSQIAAALPNDAGSDVVLSPIARCAVELLLSRGAPDPQSPATVFAGTDQVGASDAG